MKHVSLGGLDVSRIGLGAMTMAGVLSVVRKPCSPRPCVESWS
jgi:aryl-alcohol dehydrogenase-like predicted oxidoreductase